jgi:molybdopterin-guanine dinucleotide biosynthesis protein B
MMKIFSITGWSGSGKTTLMARLILHFKAKNKRVVAVKSAPDKYYLEPESKDTFKYLEAGAQTVYLAARNELLTMRHISTKEDVFAILQREVSADSCDLLLLEGLRRHDIPMIEVFDSSKSDGPKFPFKDLAAIVSDKPVTGEIPNFDIDNIKDISTFMEAYNE